MSNFVYNSNEFECILTNEGRVMPEIGIIQNNNCFYDMRESSCKLRSVGGLSTGLLPPQPYKIIVEPRVRNNILASRYINQKSYELKDHLGNVNSVVSDLKTATLTTGGEPENFGVTLKTITNYYPFGAPLSGRTAFGNDYRFGFNGMEKDDEISGSTGSHYTATFWEYDSRLGRRWNVDPVDKPWESSYACFHNNPIYWTDPEGNDPPEKTKKYTVQKGDNLTNIAKQNNVSVDDLVSWNDNITDPDKIYAGDEINVSNPARWVGAANGQWTDTENPGELWAKDDDGNWYDRNQSFGDWYAQEAAKTGEVWLMSSEDIQALKSICVDMVSWGMYSYGTGNSMPKTRGWKTPKGVYKPPLRLAYESEVLGLKKVGETMLKNGKSKEVVARTLTNMRRNIGIKYKNMTPKNMQNQIYQRNMELYGDKYGPTIEYFRAQGKTWEQIIQSSSRPGGKDMIFGIKF